MSVTHVHKDLDSLTMTMTADFAAPIERVWEVWADPRRLERWWGPPTHPATFVEHDLVPGGRMHYFMTSPDGDKYHGCWEILTVDAPHSIELDDAFADDSGAPNPDLPLSRMRISLAAHGDGTRMEVVSVYASREAMEQVIAMGVEEGMTLAVNQIDGILAESA